jgi:hypothetical protein
MTTAVMAAVAIGFLVAFLVRRNSRIRREENEF